MGMGGCTWRFGLDWSRPVALSAPVVVLTVARRYGFGHALFMQTTNNIPTTRVTVRNTDTESGITVVELQQTSVDSLRSRLCGCVCPVARSAAVAAHVAYESCLREEYAASVARWESN